MNLNIDCSLRRC